MRELKSLRQINLNRVIIAHININSLANKFDQLKLLVQTNIDILIVGETKLDDTFPTNQFSINGFSKPYRMDRNRFGGGIMIFIREDIPSKLMSNHTFPNDIESLLIEINLKKSTFLLLGGYRPPRQSDTYSFEAINRGLDMYRDTFKKLLLTGDFNTNVTEPCLEEFLDANDLKNIVKNNTCFKNPLNPSCIDFFLTNSPQSFQNTSTISTGLSDFHKMIITVHRSTFRKAKANVIQYRCFKNFDNILFRSELRESLSKSIDCESFTTLCTQAFNRHAPIKKKTLRANQVPYMTKTLRKAIMRRSNLENKFLKNVTPENKAAYRKQRNLCSKLYKKERRKYYSNLDPSNFTDNKMFWKTVKSFLTDKGTTSRKITLIDSGEILTEDVKVAETLNCFFSDAPKKLNMTVNQYLLNSTDGLNDPVDIALKKFDSHPSILQIRKYVSNTTFSFNAVSQADVETVIKNFNPKKVGVHNDIPVKNFKQNYDICSPILLHIISDAILQSTFPNKLKLADIATLSKNDDVTNKANYRPISMLPIVSKVFEKLIQNQIGGFIESKLFPFMCGYRKRI